MNKLLESSSSEYDSSAGSRPIPKAKEEDETDAFRAIEFDNKNESKTPLKMEDEETEQGMNTYIYSLPILKTYEVCKHALFLSLEDIFGMSV